jgi:hypothetical protein
MCVLAGMFTQYVCCIQVCLYVQVCPCVCVSTCACMCVELPVYKQVCLHACRCDCIVGSGVPGCADLSADVRSCVCACKGLYVTGDVQGCPLPKLCCAAGTRPPQKGLVDL